MELYNDDCFNVFSKINDKSIDLFILDLPYNCTACKWDTPIDLNQMWIDIKRIMKPTAVIVFFCNTKFGNTLINSNPKWFRYDLVWEKSNAVGFLSANKTPLRKHENIYIFKNKGGTYNPQKTVGKPYNGFSSEDKMAGEVYGQFKSFHNANKGERHPTSILKYKNVKRGSLHPTQKPTDLLEWIIKTYSNEGETIMDFTMGSGSTGEACKNTNRKFIGVEKDTDIFNLARDRLLEN
jgi:site-specific DNA-methyltransferase (adenine-specific)